VRTQLGVCFNSRSKRLVVQIEGHAYPVEGTVSEENFRRGDAARVTRPHLHGVRRSAARGDRAINPHPAVSFFCFAASSHATIPAVDG